MKLLCTPEAIHHLPPLLTCTRHLMTFFLTLLPHHAHIIIHWEQILPWIDPSRRSSVECILSFRSFRRHVLLPTAHGILCHSRTTRRPSIPHELQRQLISFGYLKPPAHTILCSCPIFAVPKSDGNLRLIWDGRPLNSQCQPPPSFHFIPLSSQLSHLLSGNIRRYLTFDFSTFFIQLTPHHKVASYFGTRLFDSSEWVVAGLPMGFTWAPFIAQSTSEGFANKLSHGLDCILTMMYIDNGISAISAESEDLADQRLLAHRTHLESCAKDCGIVLKQSAIEQVH